MSINGTTDERMIALKDARGLAKSSGRQLYLYAGGYRPKVGAKAAVASQTATDEVY
jgi:hypothetical protein